MHIANCCRHHAVTIALYCCLHFFAAFSLKDVTFLELKSLLGDFPVQRFLTRCFGQKIFTLVLEK